MVQQHIYNLLLDNDCVVVPGLGGFVCQYHPAIIDHRKGIITPPGRSVAFNRALQQNDGLLAQHISVREAISYKQAEEKIREFVAECNHQLHRHGSLLLTGIGRLYMDELQHIQFSPAAELLPLEEAFSLQSVAIRPITRLKDSVGRSEKEEAEVVPITSPQKNHQQSSWPYWIAASVAAVFLSATLWINARQPGVSEGLKAGFSFLQSGAPVQEHVVAPSVRDLSSEITTLTEGIIAESAEEAVPPSDKPVYAIVVGAFKGPVSAGRLADQLKGRGYDAEVIHPDKGMWLKVIIHVQAEDESIALKTIRSEVEPQAWLLQPTEQ